MPYDPKSRKRNDTHLFDQLMKYVDDDHPVQVTEPIRFQRVLHEGELAKKQIERARDIKFIENEAKHVMEVERNQESRRSGLPKATLITSRHLEGLPKYESRNNGSERGAITSARGPGVLPIIAHQHDNGRLPELPKWHIEKMIRESNMWTEFKAMAVGPNTVDG